MGTSSRLTRRLTRRLAVLVTALLVTPPGMAASAAGEDPSRDVGPGVYVVTLVERPAAAYSGGVPGFTRTRPRAGERFDADRRAVRAYQRRLRAAQDGVLDDLGDPPVLYRYSVAVNGFAARLTGSQVKQLRATPGVALVERSRTQQVDTVDSPDLLGAARAWARVGGAGSAGRGTVIGVVDTGIWPENPSFAGLPQRRPGTAGGPGGFEGACVPAEQWTGEDCTTKVVSARWFVKGFGADRLAEAEYLSARDGSGHGTHAAAVAAGNDGVRVRIDDQDFGEASGMAPAAGVAVYKACWSAPDPDDDGCTTADTVAAVDRAVADGVDVLNYSASGPAGPEASTDTLELAFLSAATAGVFVATSAGNRGPITSSVAHPSPWVTTVGANSHHLLQGSLVLGDGSSYVGAMVSDAGVPRAGLVLSTDAAADEATSEEARLCEVGALDAVETQGRIVVCDRGTVPRVDKSASVHAAGGVGMVLANTEPDQVEADVHAVPTVHLDAAAADEVKAYVEDHPHPTAALDPRGADDTTVPRVAEFSGRGPVAGGDVLKPDLTAPGVGVVSAVAPPTSFGHLWDLASGTSASAAHVSGLAALAIAAHPGWSPAAVKSAMMTTATSLEGPAGPLVEGAGQVSADELLDPGLVFDLTRGDYLRYLHGQGFRNADGSPVADRGVPAARLNLPSIAVGSLAGVGRVTRRVTNVSTSTETYTSRVTGLDGVDVRVTPRSLTLDPGETRRFRVRFRTEPGAQLDGYTDGHLTWTGPSHQVRVPVAVRPVLVAAPAEVTASLTDRSVTLAGVSGSGRRVGLTTLGLVAATVTPLSLASGELDPAAPAVDADTARLPLTVPAGTALVRLELDSLRHTDDTDLFVHRDGVLVASATSGSGDETVTLADPEPGEYDVYAHVAATEEQAPASADLFTWVVADGAAGNVALSTDAVDSPPGAEFRVRLSWDDLSLTRRWFGAVRYGDSGHQTLVSLR